ncbi:MAG: fibrobacter succinogenes major paralogous domain-containing protein [Bacteroidetes bacterium]|nr:fibrobacter succinogenes major paralogous domain-containing protein [Bacteroidota bacterium]
MKKLALTLLAVVAAAILFCQTPQAFKYQTVIRDNTGQLIVNQNVSFRISILKGSISGPPVYVEIHNDITNNFGLSNLEIGYGIPLGGYDFIDIDWGSDSYFLQVELDVQGLTNYQLMGTTQLLSVPYALHAATTSDTTRWRKGENGNLFYNKGKLGVGTENPIVKLDIRGTNPDDGTALSLGNSDNSHRLLLYGGRTGDPNPFIHWNQSDPLRFTTDEGGWSEKMRITGDGSIGIGTMAPDNSALVDISSSTKGFVAPRMTSIERMAIPTPASGLLVYQTDGLNGYYFYSGYTWELIGSGATKIDDLTDAIAGGDNVFIGTNSGVNFTFSGNGGNSALGNSALFSITSGWENTAVGLSALAGITIGNRNVAIGAGANETNQEGSYNTMIGYKAGANSSASGNVFIGANAGFNESSGNKLYIENSDSGTPLVYGEFDNDLIRINGVLDINNAYQLPKTDGDNGQVMQSNGEGIVSWEDQIDSTTIASMGFISGNNYSCIDYDGNAYPTIQIGNTVWMAENLRVTHYNNGYPIPYITDDGVWSSLNYGGYCWYMFSQSNYEKYGVLYNWYAVVDIRKLCPQGWHTPSGDDWDKLILYLGGENVAGGKMKSVTALWEDPNTDATNSVGFSGLPGGFQSQCNGSFGEGGSGSFWESTAYDLSDAWWRRLICNDSKIDRHHFPKQEGHSVRCIKD